MKKIITTAVCVVTVLSFAGCAQQGAKLENIDPKNVLPIDQVNMNDYNNNLTGLEDYFIKLGYIPAATTPTEMMYKVIGAIDGDRYIFNFNNSGVVMELYEYEPDNLNDDAKRVLGEIKENGSFHVFGKENIDAGVTYEATLSDNGMYMMIYTDNNNGEDHVLQKKTVIEAFKGFHKDSSKRDSSDKDTKKDESKTEESKAEESKADDSKSEESKAEESKTEESKTEESKSDESKSEESKAEESKSDESKSEESKAEESKTEESAA